MSKEGDGSTTDLDPALSAVDASFTWGSGVDHLQLESLIGSFGGFR